MPTPTDVFDGWDTWEERSAERGRNDVEGKHLFFQLLEATTHHLTLAEFTGHQLEGFHDNQAGNYGIGGGYSWNNVACHSYERERENTPLSNQFKGDSHLTSNLLFVGMR